MPRIDLWAVEEDVKIAEKTNSCSMDRLSSEMDTSCFTPREIIEKENGTNTGKHPAEMIECQFDKKASYDWMTFIEQKEFEMKFFGLSDAKTLKQHFGGKIVGLEKRTVQQDRDRLLAEVENLTVGSDGQTHKSDDIHTQNFHCSKS